jgi:hypothetical protein
MIQPVTLHRKRRLSATVPIDSARLDSLRWQGLVISTTIARDSVPGFGPIILSGCGPRQQ